MRFRIHISAVILGLAACLPLLLYAGPPKDSPGAQTLAFMKVRLDAPVKFSHLKLGDKLHGKVMRNVYSGYRLMVPKDSAIDITVSRMKRQRKKHSSIWPWPVPVFLPKYGKMPEFGSADVTLAGREPMRFHVVAVRPIEGSPVVAKSRTKARIKAVAKAALSSHPSDGTEPGRGLSGVNLELVVRAGGPEAQASSAPLAPSAESSAASPLEFGTISAGSNAELALLAALSASKTRAGYPFKAVLVQPMRLSSGEVLPEGTIFEGHVTKSIPPRRLSRSGSLYITFTRLELPGEGSRPIAASVSGVDVSQGSRMRLSSEGGMSGGNLGKARLLLELGVGAGVSKVADDTYQLIVEAVISTATDASTAGAARLISFAFTGSYWLTRRGRDVKLPRYTMITIRFDRPPSLFSSELVPQQEATR